MCIRDRIYGPVDRDYYLEFDQKLTGEEAMPAIQYKTNSALEKYQVERTKVGQTYEQYTICLLYTSRSFSAEVENSMQTKKPPAVHSGRLFAAEWGQDLYAAV